MIDAFEMILEKDFPIEGIARVLANVYEIPANEVELQFEDEFAPPTSQPNLFGLVNKTGGEFSLSLRLSPCETHLDVKAAAIVSRLSVELGTRCLLPAETSTEQDCMLLISSSSDPKLVLVLEEYDEELNQMNYYIK
ncbi:hypothetical protein [Massilia sp. YIM B04103]|uniref:hypothetical protein n=1 Tax=Massilia sp. YIM B04103 TaxID=2963106 RepID=UPI00210DADEC|nr:hypothetical protein [Massilia sp. YIM B04103]